MPSPLPREGAAARNRRLSYRLQPALLGLIATLLLVFALRLGRTVLLPFAAAFFLALLLRPVQRWVEARLPRKLRWLGVVSALLLLLLVLGALAAAVGLAVSRVRAEGPQLVQQLQAQLEQLQGWAAQRGLVSAGGGGGGLGERAAKLSGGLVGTTASLLGELVLVLFFVVLMLLEAPDWRTKVGRALSASRARQLHETAGAASAALRRYLLTLTVLGLATGLLEGVWLAVMGVKLAFVWALLFFVLNYIPGIGSVVAAVPPVLFAFVTQGVSRGLLVGAGILVIEQVMGNLVGPMVEGKRVALSPLVVLVSVVFWAFLWGPVGGLLGVPLTLTVFTLCQHVPRLRPTAILLGQAEAG